MLIKCLACLQSKYVSNLRLFGQALLYMYCILLSLLMITLISVIDLNAICTHMHKKPDISCTPVGQRKIYVK